MTVEKAGRFFLAAPFSLLDGPVAQRLEQGTHNPLVPGSNPGGPSLRLEAQRGREWCHARAKQRRTGIRSLVPKLRDCGLALHFNFRFSIVDLSLSTCATPETFC